MNHKIFVKRTPSMFKTINGIECRSVEKPIWILSKLTNGNDFKKEKPGSILYNKKNSNRRLLEIK